jgi:hypothetical protein
MAFPSFFAEIRPIILRDRLAQFLGAADGGLIEYHYADVVKLAGHSCPTVAGAYLMTSRALNALYGDDMPERGDIRVDFSEAQSSGVAGVTASVVGLLTGAAGIGGFKGIAGNFSRRDLLHFDIELPGEVCFTRQDTGDSICASLQLAHIPPDPRMGPLLQRLLAGERDAVVAEVFATLWQDRVRQILVDHFDDPETVLLTR